MQHYIFLLLFVLSIAHATSRVAYNPITASDTLGVVADEPMVVFTGSSFGGLSSSPPFTDSNAATNNVVSYVSYNTPQSVFNSNKTPIHVGSSLLRSMNADGFEPSNPLGVNNIEGAKEDSSQVVVSNADSVSSSALPDSSLYVPWDSFKYADNKRYTFLGGRPLIKSDVNTLPLVGMGAAYAALFTALHINQNNAWWKDDAGGWHVIEDLEYARFLDKFGHFYTAYIMSVLPGDMLMESGMAQTPARWIGAGLGLLYNTYVEVEDGYASNWGFSPSDEIANFCGSTFYLLQYYFPVLEDFTPRWSYVPSHWVNDASITDRPSTFIDDYNSTTFWLAVNVNNLLPKNIAEYWPDWMMLSAGYGIRNYAVTNSDGTQAPVTRRFMVGIDYDWIKILPEAKFGFLNYVRQWLNYLRLPGPTLEFGDDGVSFGLFYPFAIVVPF